MLLVRGGGEGLGHAFNFRVVLLVSARVYAVTPCPAAETLSNHWPHVGWRILREFIARNLVLWCGANPRVFWRISTLVVLITKHH